MQRGTVVPDGDLTAGARAIGARGAWRRARLGRYAGGRHEKDPSRRVEGDGAAEGDSSAWAEADFAGAGGERGAAGGGGGAGGAGGGGECGVSAGLGAGLAADDCYLGAAGEDGFDALGEVRKVEARQVGRGGVPSVTWVRKMLSNWKTARMRGLIECCGKYKIEIKKCNNQFMFRVL